MAKGNPVTDAPNSTAAKSSELEKAAKIHLADSVDSQCSGDRD